MRVLYLGAEELVTSPTRRTRGVLCLRQAAALALDDP